MIMKTEKQERSLYFMWGLVAGIIFGVLIGGL